MGMKHIVCVGNQTEDTAQRAEYIARQYNLQCVGLSNSADITPGVCYTNLGTISTEQFLLLGEQADVVIMLDQSISSYDHEKTYKNTFGCCYWLKSFTHVIFENQNLDIYITTQYTPPNKFNLELHQVVDNQAILDKLKTLNILGRRIFIEFTQVSSLDTFNTQLHNLLEYTPLADFVIFRASKHEADEIHSAVTARLLKTKEFVMLTPVVFNINFRKNIQVLLENHWQWVYGPRRPEHYHTVYTQL
jgi:hypothetical protein